MVEDKELVVSLRSYWDEAWKDVIRLYFKEFTELCWLEAYHGIDWEKGYEFLEQEFQAILIEDEIGGRIVDKLIKIWKKDGSEQWVLVHIEIQASRISNFPERMYVYNYRIYDRFRKNIASLAILIDGNIHWRPNCYERRFWGTTLKMEYPVLKLLDFRDSKEELENSNNPFALVILAQLEALETKKNFEAMLPNKVTLTRGLFKHGWTGDQIYSLYKFLDGIMTLPKELELTYNNRVKEIEEEFQVSYMTTAERIGYEQGVEQGIQKGEFVLIQNLLESKFSHIPPKYLEILIKADAATLLTFGKMILVAKTIDEVFN